jgi:hypothetical protein
MEPVMLLEAPAWSWLKSIFQLCADGGLFVCSFLFVCSCWLVDSFVHCLPPICLLGVVVGLFDMEPRSGLQLPESFHHGRLITASGREIEGRIRFPSASAAEAQGIELSFSYY